MSKKANTTKSYLPVLKSLVMEIFVDHPHKSYNYKQISKKFNLEPYYEKVSEMIFEISEDEIRSMTMQVIEELTVAGELEETDRGKYRLFPREHFITGKIDVTSNGNAYVMNDEFEDDIFIARGFTLTAMKGDLVKVSLYARKKGQRAEGEVVEVLERARQEFVGTIQMSERFAFLSSDSAKSGVDIFIPLNKLNGAQQGMKAVARIISWDPEAKNPSGEIIKILGTPGDNDTEMDAILVEYGFPLVFPDEVEKEADEIPFKIPAKEITKRRDFRTITTFTIDPFDAKDFDDALSVQTLANGNLEIGIHIADVSHYVKPDTALDAEGYSRATSIYLVDRVIPMLPEKLSNMVCSLRPGENKLTFSAVFEINDKAEVLNEWFGRTVIHSDKRFSYEEAQEVIETGEGPLKQEILALDKLAKILRKKRYVDGAITFEKVEVKFNLDEKGMPLGVYLKENKDSNKLIEEFMLLANRRVAEFVGKKMAGSKGKVYPFVYRVHGTPVTERLLNFALFAGRFGHKINTSTDREVAHSLNKLMQDIKGTREQNVLEQLAIRSMAKAIYTTDNIGHYGLAFDFYTHFTSPIRRYPDVMVHRLLDHYLKEGAPVKSDDLEAKCKHSTEMEIRASEAERSSIKFKQAQYLMGREGEIFAGMITGVTEWGIYVELTESKCEGLVRIRDMKDDFYELDEKNYCLVGHRTKRKFQLGDLLKVKLRSADLLKRQIDFIIADDTPFFPDNPVKSTFGTSGNSSSKGGGKGKPKYKTGGGASKAGSGNKHGGKKRKR